MGKMGKMGKSGKPTGRRLGKRILGIALAVIMLMSGMDMGAITAFAAEPHASEKHGVETPRGTSDGADGVIEGSEISVFADNSLGRIFEDALEDGSVAARSETGSGVYAIRINGAEAAVSFQTAQDGALIVGIYEEDGDKLLASGNTYVAAGDKEAVVAIETETLPEYFTVRAFLADALNFRPFCEVYESDDYTQKMQEFYAKTTADFDSEQVLNFDEDTDNNFLVFSDSVKVITYSADETVNTVEECDEEQLIYKIGSPDERFTSLQTGDIFAYYYEVNRAIITKVVSLESSEADGKTILTISGEDPDFDSIIDFIKVGADNPRTDGGQGVYAARAAAGTDAALMAAAAEEGTNAGWSLPDIEFKWESETGEEEGKLSVSEIGGVAAVRIFRDAREELSAAELEISYGAKVKLEAEVFSAEKSWLLGNPTMPTNVPGVNVGCRLEIKLEVAASVNVEGSLAGSVGVHIDRDGKPSNISRPPKFTVTRGGEISVKLGLVISPRVEFVHEKILSAEVHIDFGLKLTLAASEKRLDNASKQHVCSLCFTVTLNPYLTITGEVTVLLGSKSVELLDKDLTDGIKAFFSPEYSPHFGLGECPHWIYNGKVRVLDRAGNPVADATVKSSVSEGTTDEDGIAVLRMNVGGQNLYVEKDGKRYSKAVDVPDETGMVTFSINTGASSPLSSETRVKAVYATSASHSGIYARRGVAYAALTEDNSLYMWGDNCDKGLIGVGEESGVWNDPVKVLDHVKDFQFSPDGTSCAAITTKGSLYTWGENWGGRLGNGKTGVTTSPCQVTFPKSGTKVEKFSFLCDGSTYAAITTDGDLYLWGHINYIDNGSTVSVPQYIMNNVEEVFVSVSNTFAAITRKNESAPQNSRSLFLWGSNVEGLAGQPYNQWIPSTATVLPSDYQEKELGAFMSGVKECYLGDSIGAALREDGSLWMWGKDFSSYRSLDNDEQIWDAKKLIATDVARFYWEDSTGSYISPSSMSCAAVTTDGKLYMWGRNQYGQLGTGGTTDVDAPRLQEGIPPQEVAGVQNVRAFHMENATCAAITTDGKLYMWGRNEGGALGNGNTEICTVPTQILSEEEVKEFAFLADARLSAALTKDKALYMWGTYAGTQGSTSFSSAVAIHDPELKSEQTAKLMPYPALYYDLGVTSFKSESMCAGFAYVQTDGALYESVRGKNEGRVLEAVDETAAELFCEISHTGGDSYYRKFYDNVIVRGNRGSVYTWTEQSGAEEVPEIRSLYFFGGAEIMKELPQEQAASLMTAALSLQADDPEGTVDGADGDCTRTADFIGLRSNELYNIYAMKSKTAENAFASDNLLYIGQSLSDDGGSLHVTFEMKEDCAEPEIFCVGISRTDLSETEIEAADIFYDGYSHQPQVTVSCNGRTLIPGTDYKVYFGEYAQEIGEYTLTVEGIGLFQGEKTVTFQVKEKKDDEGGDTPGGEGTGDGDDTPGGEGTGDGGDTPGGEGTGDGGDTPGGDTPGGDTPHKPDYGEVLPQDVPKDGVIPTGLWIAGVAEDGYDYTGSAIKPEVRVYDGTTLLIEKTDYTIVYKNNTQANDASAAGKAPTITVAGKGNYTGKDTKTFKILRLDIGTESGENLFEADDMAVAYSAKAQKPVPELYWNGRKLKNSTDYTVTYHKGAYGGTETEELSSVQDPGNYYIRLTGNKNYTGTRRVKLTVLPAGTDAQTVKPIARVKAARIPSQLYQTENKAGAVTPEVTVTDGKLTLTKDVHYTVTYSNNKKPGTAYAIIKGVEAKGYSGTRRISFKITGIAMNKVSVTGLQTFVYDGTAKTPQLTLSAKVNGTAAELVKDRDYSVQWQKNAAAGTATVVFTGRNGYTGTMKKTFKIKAYNIAENQDQRFRVEMTEASVPYAKGGARPGLTVTFRQADGKVLTLKEGRDYTVSCKNNKALNDGSGGRLPTLTVKGKGNFNGVYKESLNYKITAQDIGRLTLNAADKVYQSRGNIYATKITVTDLDGKALKAGTDYDKNLTYTYKHSTTLEDGTLRAAGATVEKTDIIPAGTALCVTVTPKGNYTGTALTGEYSIKTYNLSAAKVTIPAQDYTGRAITLDKADESQILVKAGGRKVDADQFEIVGYSNNVKKGTATVTIRGTGNYGGEKTVKFTIKPKGFLWWWSVIS